MSVLELTHPAPALLGHTWSVEPRRSVVEVRMPGTPWRARLRLLGGRLHTPDTDGESARLSAVLAPRASFASLPMSRRWFLPDARTTQRVMLVADGAVAQTPTTMNLATTAAVWVGDRRWPMQAHIALRVLGPDHGVLELTGELTCRPYTTLYGRTLRIDAAAEVTRCD